MQDQTISEAAAGDQHLLLYKDSFERVGDIQKAHNMVQKTKKSES